MARGPSERNGDGDHEPGEDVTHSHSPVLMIFAVGAGAAVIVSGIWIGFSPFQIIVGIVGIVVGLWALVTRRHRPE